MTHATAVLGGWLRSQPPQRSHLQNTGDCEEKRGATGNHTKVPHGVAKRKAVPAIERQSTCIADPARYYEKDRDGPDHLADWHAPTEAQPAHGELERDGGALKSASFMSKNDAGNGQSPDRCQEDPARMVPEWQHCKRCRRRSGR